MTPVYKYDTITSILPVTNLNKLNKRPPGCSLKVYYNKYMYTKFMSYAHLSLYKELHVLYVINKTPQTKNQCLTWFFFCLDVGSMHVKKGGAIYLILPPNYIKQF